MTTETDNGDGHWARQAERGAYWGLRILGAVYRLLGRRICLLLMQPVVLYFFLTAGEQRRAVRQYWQMLYRFSGEGDRPVTRWRLWRHYQSFSRMALNKFSAWSGDIAPDRLIRPDDDMLLAMAETGQGGLVIASHLGNYEITRAFSKYHTSMNITVFAHTAHAAKFNRLLTRYNPEAALNVVQVSEIDAGTAIDLANRIEQGELVVIAGDRTPVDGDKRISHVSFLGGEAPFSQGAVILGALLKCPVYGLLCFREGDRFRLVFDKLFDQVALPRQGRAAALDDAVQRYASWLESYCLEYPDQWYNFFRFWTESEETEKQTGVGA